MSLSQQKHDYFVAEALIIMLKTGAIHKCEMCEGHYKGLSEIVDAYKYGNFLFSREDSSTTCFSTRKEMTDTIKEVFDETPNVCCS